MGPVRDRTHNPWICSQTRICCSLKEFFPERIFVKNAFARKSAFWKKSADYLNASKLPRMQIANEADGVFPMTIKHHDVWNWHLRFQNYYIFLMLIANHQTFLRKWDRIQFLLYLDHAYKTLWCSTAGDSPVFTAQTTNSLFSDRNFHSPCWTWTSRLIKLFTCRGESHSPWQVY